ncbi:MAG: universal stress protein [Deltaproteobacteria bacterium]|nr:universal stress protein [Deltaproteobacteria bacterium]
MNLLLAYDGSEPSKSALALTKKLAKEMNAKVNVVVSRVGGRASDTKDIDKAEMQLKFVEEALAQAGVTCQQHLLIRGLEPGEDIVDFAEEVQADFIIVGIVKTSRVGKIITGSTAQYVILNARCPVITVK